MQFTVIQKYVPIYWINVNPVLSWCCFEISKNKLGISEQQHQLRDFMKNSLTLAYK